MSPTNSVVLATRRFMLYLSWAPLAAEPSINLPLVSRLVRVLNVMFTVPVTTPSCMSAGVAAAAGAAAGAASAASAASVSVSAAKAGAWVNATLATNQAASSSNDDD